MQGITEVAAQQRVALFARGTDETRVDSDASLQVTCDCLFGVAVFVVIAAAAAASADYLCSSLRCRGESMALLTSYCGLCNANAAADDDYGDDGDDVDAGL